MKKIIHFLFIALFILGLTACNKKVEEVALEDEIIEPIVKYSSLKEINELMDVNIVLFDEEATNETFIVKNNEAAVYSFTSNDMDITLAASRNLAADIFELYDQETEYVPEASSPVFYSTDYGKLARFAYDDVQYNMFIADERNYSEKEFIDILRDWMIKLASNEKEELKELSGIYYEEDLKGSMQIYPASEDSVYINISIPEDEDSFNSWSMKAVFIDGKLVYDRSEHFLDNLKEKTSISVNDGIGGYLLKQDDGFDWSGSNNSVTSSYRFIKH